MSRTIEHEIKSGTFYTHKLDHRDGTPVKSQWTISEAEERTSFTRALDAAWRTPPHTCWGLHIKAEGPEYLGRSASRIPGERRLFMAKFVDGTRSNHWHGYPADPLLHEQDVPPSTVLRGWLDRRVLRSALVRKVAQRKRCSL